MMDKESIEKVCDVATQAQEVVHQDLQLAADEVIPIASVAVSPGTSNEKDGPYFLQLHWTESQRLLMLADEYEAEMESTSDTLSEDVKGKYRAAFGQARLLVRQKLKQFEGLCHKNLANKSDEPFPTTCEDLAGFWDMVYLQVEHVNGLFRELTELKNKGWPAESTPEKVPAKKTAKPAAKANPKLSEKAQEAARQREEQRKKILEERRRLAKLQLKSDEAIEIFAQHR